MFELKSLAITLLISLPAGAGVTTSGAPVLGVTTAGDGGHAVVCEIKDKGVVTQTSVQFLESWVSVHQFGFQSTLTAANLRSRLLGTGMDPVIVDDVFVKMENLRETKYWNNIVPVSEHLPVKLPAGCHLEQVGVFYRQLNGSVIMQVNAPLYRRLSPDDQLRFFVHETFHAFFYDQRALFQWLVYLGAPDEFREKNKWIAARLGDNRSVPFYRWKR